MKFSIGRSLAMSAIGVLLVVACGGGAPATQRPSVAAPGGTQAPASRAPSTQAASPQAASPPAASPLAPAAQVECPQAPAGQGGSPQPSGQNAKSFWVGFTSVGLSSAPFLAALHCLEENQGYTIETPIIAQSELVTEGVAQNQFAFGSGANNSVMLAVQNGANLKVLVDRVANEWTLYVATDITDCAGLAGKRLALHSDGAVSTAMVRNYINTTCEGTQPQEIFIEGSPNRVAAMLEDEVDASPLELGDSIRIDAEAGDRYHLLSSFSADLPDLKTTSIYVNGDFAAQNPETVKDVVRAVVGQFRLIEGDPAYLKRLALDEVPDAINEDTIDAAVQKYVELGMFPPDGGVTQENLEYTSEFFGPDGAGVTDALMPVEDWADLSYLEAVLSELDSQ